MDLVSPGSSIKYGKVAIVMVEVNIIQFKCYTTELLVKVKARNGVFSVGKRSVSDM